MNPIKLIPGQSIGHLKLGMNPDEILSALEAMFPGSSASVQIIEDRMFRPDGTSLIRYISSPAAPVQFFFMVEYNVDKAVEISTNRQLPVVYELQTMQFLDIFGTPTDILVPYLKRFSTCICDSADEDLGTEYIFPELGLRLWRENPFHHKLLLDESYMETMSMVIPEEFKNTFFEIVSVRK